MNCCSWMPTMMPRGKTKTKTYCNMFTNLMQNKMYISLDLPTPIISIQALVKYKLSIFPSLMCAMQFLKYLIVAKSADGEVSVDDGKLSNPFLGGSKSVKFLSSNIISVTSKV